MHAFTSECIIKDELRVSEDADGTTPDRQDLHTIVLLA